MAGPAKKAGVATRKSVSMGPKSVASKPGPVVPRRAAAATPAAPAPAVKASMRTQRMPAAQAIAHAAPQARFQRTAPAPAQVAPQPLKPRMSEGMNARIGIPKGETITPIQPPKASPAGSYRAPKAPMQPDLSKSNAHGYVSDMAGGAHGAPLRPGYSRPVQPKT